MGSCQKGTEFSESFFDGKELSRYIKKDPSSVRKNFLESLVSVMNSLRFQRSFPDEKFRICVMVLLVQECRYTLHKMMTDRSGSLI